MGADTYRWVIRKGRRVFSPGAVFAALLLFSLSQPLSSTPGPLIGTVLVAGWIVWGTIVTGRAAVRLMLALL